MPTKPFIAARIPEKLNLCLESHSKATGESRSEILINALAAYLKFTLENDNKKSANDRLSALEIKVAELERLVKEPHQMPLPGLSSPPVLKTEKQEITSVNAASDKAQESDRSRLNNREMSEVTGIKYETVRSKHRHNTPIAFNNKKYLPVKEGTICKWQLEST